MVDAAADHRPRAGPPVPHRLPARRQLLQARARRPARSQPRAGPWRSSRSSAGSASARTKPGGSSTTCARSRTDHGPPGTQDRRLGRSRRRGRRAHAGADRELRVRLRDVVRRRPRRDRARHAPVEHRASARPSSRDSCRRAAGSSTSASVPSPLVSFAIRELGASGGIAITGSHNDASWNALKFFGPDGALLNAAKNEELLDVYHGAAFELATWDRLKPVETAPDVEDRYLEHLAERPRRRSRSASRRFRVAVDFTNGACGAVASRFLESLRCTLLPVNAEPTGEFAHPPAPDRREHAADRRRWPAASTPTSGRPSTWTATGSASSPAEGTALSEEYSLPLVATPRLRRRPGPVVTSYSTSGMVEAAGPGPRPARDPRPGRREPDRRPRPRRGRGPRGRGQRRRRGAAARRRLRRPAGPRPRPRGDGDERQEPGRDSPAASRRSSCGSGNCPARRTWSTR